MWFLVVEGTVDSACGFRPRLARPGHRDLKRKSPGISMGLRAQTMYTISTLGRNLYV